MSGSGSINFNLIHYILFLTYLFQYIKRSCAYVCNWMHNHKKWQYIMPINVSRCRDTRWFDIYALMISCKLTNQGIYPPYICIKFDYLTSFSHILLCTCVLDLHLGTCTWLLIDRWHKQISNWLQYRSHYRLWIRLIHLPLYCRRWFQVRRGVVARRCYLGKAYQI